MRLKTKDGKYVSGYVFKGVTEPEGEFDLSNAYKKFGDETSLGKTLSVHSSKGDLISAGFDSKNDVKLKVDRDKLDEMEAMDKPPFGECTFWCYEHYDWYMCFYCCSISPDC